jgi:hypothetical protein
MAKSPEESLALFGLDSGVSDAARAAVGAKPGVAAKPPPGRSPLASTNLAAPGKPIGPSSSRPGGGAPPPIPPPSSQPQAPAKDIAVLHDRNEEEESTRAVSREEMLRGHDSVVIGEDSEAHGEDATLAIAPGFNEANSSQAAAFAATLAKDAGSHPGAPPPPPGFDPNFGQPPPPAPPHGTHGMPANQGWQQPPPMAPQHGWQDPNAYHQQQQQQGHSNPQSYPGMAVGPVSGPHLPAQSWTPNPPGSQPHFPAGAPQSQPHMQVAQNANQPIPYPGQPGLQQLNPFDASRRKSKVSGQIILLGIVGVVCLAIFITGIVLFATTKF